MDKRRHNLSRQPGKNSNSHKDSSSGSSSSEGSSTGGSPTGLSLSDLYIYSGPPGPAGPIGVTGATGATGAGLAAFAYLSNTADGTVLAGTDVTFNSDLSGAVGIYHIPGTASITVVNAGKYHINFSVFTTDNIAQNIGVTVNGTVVAPFKFRAGSGELKGTVMLNLNVGDVVTIRNTGSNNYSLMTSPNINAYVSIFKMN